MGAADRRRPSRGGLQLFGAFLAGSLLVTVLLLLSRQEGGRTGACFAGQLACVLHSLWQSGADCSSPFSFAGCQLLGGRLQVPMALYGPQEPLGDAEPQEQPLLPLAHVPAEQQPLAPELEKVRATASQLREHQFHHFVHVNWSMAAASPPRPLSATAAQWRKPLQLPWPPVLSELQLKRGLAFYGGGQRIERVAAALMAGQPITAVRRAAGGGHACVLVCGGLLPALLHMQSSDSTQACAAVVLPTRSSNLCAGDHWRQRVAGCRLLPPRARLPSHVLRRPQRNLPAPVSARFACHLGDVTCGMLSDMPSAQGCSR